MKRYDVLVPIAGYVQIEVEAENEKEAVDKAFKEGCDTDDIAEFDMFEHICEGNVLYAPRNNIEVLEVED